MNLTQQYQCEVLAEEIAADGHSSAIVGKWIVVGNINFPYLKDIVWC